MLFWRQVYRNIIIIIIITAILSAFLYKKFAQILNTHFNILTIYINNILIIDLQYINNIWSFYRRTVADTQFSDLAKIQTFDNFVQLFCNESNVADAIDNLIIEIMLRQSTKRSLSSVFIDRTNFVGIICSAI